MLKSINHLRYVDIIMERFYCKMYIGLHTAVVISNDVSRKTQAQKATYIIETEGVKPKKIALMNSNNLLSELDIMASRQVMYSWKCC